MFEAIDGRGLFRQLRSRAQLFNGNIEASLSDFLLIPGPAARLPEIMQLMGQHMFRKPNINRTKPAHNSPLIGAGSYRERIEVL